MAFKIPLNAFKKREIVVPKDQKLPLFDFHRIIKEEDIGRGSFGIVFKAKYENKTFVIKKLHCTEVDDIGKQFIKDQSYTR